jgi:hypothetical protein
MSISEKFQHHKYINLTTYRKNGTAVPTPVWFVEMDGALYVFTGGQSGKSKRIRANGRASVAPCDARGNPLGEFQPATACFVSEEAIKKLADKKYNQKYGLTRRFLNLMIRMRRAAHDESVLIKLSFEDSPVE